MPSVGGNSPTIAMMSPELLNPRPFARELVAVTAAVERYGRFVGMRATLVDR